MKTNKQIILFLTFMLLIILSLTVYHTVKANQEESLLFVYLDPGHGGFDGGPACSACIGGGRGH